MEKVKRKQYLNYLRDVMSYLYYMKKLSQLGVTNIKFDMPDNFMKMKVDSLKSK